VIHPVAIGHGTGLFGSLAKPLRLELVQWPPGHADGLSAADFT